jgi:prevent-host-death family protein
LIYRRASKGRASAVVSVTSQRYLEGMSYVGRKERIVSATEARARLGEILSSAARGRAVVIRRRGGRDTVLLDADEYRRLLDPLAAALQKAGEASKRAGLDRMSMAEIDAEIAAARRERRSKHGPGRS